MNNLFKNLDVDYESKMQVFQQYAELFFEYNAKVNLIAKNDEQYLIEKHVYDSLAINLFLKKHGNLKNILDIGTGGGFPSLPIAIYYPEINVCAVDSINKKIKFINECAEKLNLKNILTINSRAEDLPENMKNSFDMVTSRAMAQLREILEYAIPYVKTGGYFIAYKSLKAEEELKQAENALKILNTELVEKIKYNIPLQEQQKRVLLIFKKIKPIELIYPRKNGVVKKKPL